MIVLGPVENDRRTLEGTRIIWTLEILLAELRRDDTGLHDRRVEQISGNHGEACLVQHRLLPSLDDLAIRRCRTAQILCHGLAADRHHVTVDLALLQQLLHHRRYSAGTMK